MLEKKQKGEFCPSGSHDVLTTALETPEQSGRVRAVGSFVTPKIYFNLPRERKLQITKSELLARDRRKSEELEKAKHDLMTTKQEMISEIEKLKAMINNAAGTRHHSPLLSDKASFDPLGDQLEKLKPTCAKGFVFDDVDDCIALDNPPPPPGKKVKIILQFMCCYPIICNVCICLVLF